MDKMKILVPGAGPIVGKRLNFLVPSVAQHFEAGHGSAG